ncbi:HNH endonuclease [Acinetobacter phage Abgy2021-4-1]|nr:HNH endonuclease [Acinetobacter phage Abgy2021-4-1]
MKHTEELYKHAAALVNLKDGRFYRNGVLNDNLRTSWGYRVVRVYFEGKRVSIQAHRLAWYIYKGTMPTGQIDHIDRDPANNLESNLRDVSQSVNQHNRKAKGYTIERSTGLYYAQIKLNGKQHFLGRFKTAEEATAAYKAAKLRLHPTSPLNGE